MRLVCRQDGFDHRIRMPCARRRQIGGGQRLHPVAAQQQAGIGSETPRTFVDQRQRLAHHGFAQRVAAGMILGLLPGQQAPRGHGLDLWHHRMVGVQSRRLPARDQIKRRIADADPASTSGRCAPSRRISVAPMLAGQFGSGRHAGAHSATLAAVSPVEQAPALPDHRLQKGVDGQSTRRGAADMAAHAVADDG